MSFPGTRAESRVLRKQEIEAARTLEVGAERRRSLERVTLHHLSLLTFLSKCPRHRKQSDGKQHDAHKQGNERQPAHVGSP